jgi:HK97 family phage major capsid protein
MDRFDLKSAYGRFPKLKEVGAKLDAKRAELKRIFDEAGDELDATRVTGLSDGQDLVEVIRALNKEIDELKDEHDRLVEVARAEYESRRTVTAEPEPTARGIGAMFVASEAFRGYRPGQGIGPVATLNASIRDVLYGGGVHAALFETTAGWGPESTRIGRVAEMPVQPVRVVDVVPTFPTSQAAIKYMEETVRTNAAAETAEGAAYPEAALALTERTVDVRKIAVWLPVTDEQLEDVDQAEAYVEGRLRLFLAERLDGQILAGNGTAPNLRGTANVTGINSITQGTDPLEDAIYKAMTKIRDTGFAEPGVVFLRPADYETIRLRKTTDGVYINGSPSDVGPTRLWGVPLVQTTRMPGAVKAIVGDYANHSGLFERRGVDVQISNSHGTFFVEGKVAVRADVRVALVHFRPAAFSRVV